MTPPVAFANELRGLQDRERENIATIATIVQGLEHQGEQLDELAAQMHGCLAELKDLRLAFERQVLADQSAHKTLEAGLFELGKAYANDKGFLLGLAKKAALLAVGGGALGTAAPWLKTVLENLL